MSIAWYEREEESVIVTGGVNNIRQWSVKSGQPLSRMALGRKFQKDTIVWCVAVTRWETMVLVSMSMSMYVDKGRMLTSFYLY